MAKKEELSQEQLFGNMINEVLKIDPVMFAKNYLTIDGNPLDVSTGGWRYLADVYRYIGIESLKPDAKPVVILKGRQTAATTMAMALELFFCTNDSFGVNGKPPIHVLHCFPSLTLVQKFTKSKLSVMMRTSKDDYIAKHALSYNEDNGKRRLDVPDDTLVEKQFKNENSLWVDSNANDAQRLQSMSLDVILYDEVARMRADDIGNSKRTLTAARFGPRGQGIQLYFGTPLQKGSNFHKMWEASDKRFYHLKCEHCEEYFKLYELENDSWERIWLYGNVVQCPICGTQQDRIEAVARGKWISSRPEEDAQYVGFHFNQLLIPYFTKEVVMKEKPGIHPTNSERIWKNEILGEFYSGAEMPMSMEEIYEHCRNVNKAISFGSENAKSAGVYMPPTFMGIDWGGKADTQDSTTGKSFSSIVIISADKSGSVNIENAFKLKKNDLTHKKEVINEMFKRYDIKVAVADLGFGSDIVPDLQKDYGARIIGCLSSGSLLHPVKYDPEELRMIINAHSVVEDLFNNMRKGKILFPWKSYEQIQWLIEHCCSMEKVSATVQGRSVTRYVKGSGPNDGLMALQYAFLAFKFWLTQGFKVKSFQEGKSTLAPVLAYVPNL